MVESWKALKELGSSATDTLKQLFEFVGYIALFVTIALIVGLVVYHVAASKKGEEALAKARRTEAGIVVGYSLGIIVTLGSIKLIRSVLKGEIDTNFWLVIGLICLVVASVLVVAILAKRGVKCTKYVGAGLAVLAFAYVIVLVCVVPPTSGDYKPTGGALMYILTAIVVALAVVLGVLFDKQTSYDARSITYASICVATSFALSYVKFFTMGPDGGSITFASLVPLALYSYMFGIRKGMVAAVVYGLLQFIQSPHFYEPTQALLDYPIAFGVIGLAGIGRKFKFLKGNVLLEFAVGLFIGCALRYVAHSISGYFVFGGGQVGWAVLKYSLVYNSFVFVDYAIDLVVSAMLFASKSVRRMILLASPESQTETANV